MEQQLVLSEDEVAPSPFLPGTNIQYAIDSTSVGYFKTCPRLYYYTIIEGWRPKGESVHLIFGTLYHAALHHYDTVRLEGEDHEDGVFQVVKWLCDWYCDNKDSYPDVSEGKGSVRAKSFTSLLRSVVWYLDQYPKEKDPAETLILANGKPACELSFNFEIGWGPDAGQRPYLLCGHLDRVAAFQGELFVMDRKTTSFALTDYYWNQFEPNNQMSLYAIAGQIVIDSPIKGVIIDAALIKEEYTASTWPPFGRKFTYRTKDQNEEWLDNLHRWTTAMEACAVSGDWPMNDTACDKFGGCRFREICSKSPSVREKFLNAGFVRGEKWNPLKPR